MQFITPTKKTLSAQDKKWLLSRTEHFIALYESGRLEPKDVCYEIYRGFTAVGAEPETSAIVEARKK